MTGSMASPGYIVNGKGSPGQESEGSVNNSDKGCAVLAKVCGIDSKEILGQGEDVRISDLGALSGRVVLFEIPGVETPG
jgi:hypothetical protein